MSLPVPAAKVEGPPPEARRWSLPRRLGFRWLFAYAVLYVLPFPFNMVPGVVADTLDVFVLRLWKPPVEALAGVLGIDVSRRGGGTSDTTFDYVHVLLAALLAAAVALVWSLLDRKRANYARIADWLRVYLRMFLAVTMFDYGAIKVFKGQFPDPAPSRLLQPFGDFSPFGLMWTFMGTSRLYNYFTGAFEMLGGLLLVARRTTLLGALVCVSAMGNVVMLNLSYDVPVKLFSMHLLAMSIFLVAPDGRRLFDLFVRNRPVPAAELRPLLRGPRAHLVAVTMRTVVLLALAAWFLHEARTYQILHGDRAPKSPLYGVWSVEEFVLDGVARPPLVTDAERWRWVAFDSPRLMGIQTMDDHRRKYLIEVNETKHELTLRRRSVPGSRTTFRLLRRPDDRLELAGTLEGRRIEAVLRRREMKESVLLSRGFHWINDYPFDP